MKIQKIVCDGCGKEIEGNPIILVLESVDRETGEFVADDSATLYAPEKDFCDDCFKRIKNFIETMGKYDAVLQIKIPTEEELACIEKMIKDNPPTIMAAEPEEPTADVVQEEPKEKPKEKPKEEQKEEPKEEPQPEPKAIPEEKISEQQKPTAKDLILQGKSKAEVIELTGIKPASYDQIKYILKKNGLLNNNDKKEDPADKCTVKTYNCNDVIDKCFYSVKCGRYKVCDYLEKEGHMRGCKPEKCDKFREKR